MSVNLTQNSGKMSKKKKKKKRLHWKIEKYTGNVGKICQPVMVKTLQIRCHTLNKKRTLKKLKNCKKYQKSQGNCQSEKMGTMNYCIGKKYYRSRSFLIIMVKIEDKLK